MKIKGNNLGKSTSGVKSGGASGNVSAGKKTQAARDSQANKAAPAVSVSSTDQISSRMESAGTSRAQKVAGIKLNVDAGTYEMDSQQTANKLIDSLTDYSLA